MADYSNVPDEIEVPEGRHVLLVTETRTINTKNGPRLVLDMQNKEGQILAYFIDESKVAGKSELKRIARACGLTDEDFTDFNPGDIREKAFSAVVSKNGKYSNLSGFEAATYTKREANETAEDLPF